MAKKLRVVIPFRTTMNFHGSYDGGCKYIYNFSRYLARAGVDVTIITSLTKDKNLRKAEEDGVKYKFIGPDLSEEKKLIKFNPPYKFLFSWNLMRELEKMDFDILHSFEMLAFFYLMKNRKNRKPTIFQGWGLEPIYGPESLAQTGWRKILSNFFVKKPWLYCMKRSDKIASEGDFQLDHITRLGFPKEKVFPLLIGTDLELIDKYKNSWKDMRKELGIKKSDYLILSVCQIGPDKGIADIINSFAKVKKKISNAKLLMIGHGPYEEMMHKMVEDLNLKDSVMHRKKIPEKDLYDYYFSSDVYISAATQHDWIMGLAEAMACGLPVISSAQPFLVRDGKNGFVVGMENPSGLAKAVVKIKEGKLEKKFGKEGKRLAKEYDWGSIVRVAMDEYEGLIK